jgi:hypothetical protein
LNSQLFSSPQGVIAKIGDLGDARSSVHHQDLSTVIDMLPENPYHDPMLPDMCWISSFVDVYSFGKIIGRMLFGPIELAKRSDFERKNDPRLISRLSMLCTQEMLSKRPTMQNVVQEIERIGIHLFEPSKLLFDFEILAESLLDHL